MSLNVDLLRSSFDLVANREPQFIQGFYATLFERYPQAQPLFGRNSREAQGKMLTQALVAVLDHLEDAPWLRETLATMGARHQEYGVTNEMYGWVGECLLVTLANVAGDDWTTELEAAWTAAYGAIAGLMLEGTRPA